MKPTVKMILLTLLGLILPFGALWGPFLSLSKLRANKNVVIVVDCSLLKWWFGCWECFL